MVKILIRIIGVVVVLAIVILVVVMFQLGTIIKTGVEKFGPQFTGTTVTLEKAIVRPITGKAMMKGLVVGNPEGYKTPHSIRLGEFSADLNMKSLGSDTIVIDKILIDGPEITYEMKSLKQNNIKAIIDNVQSKSPPKEDVEPEGKTASKDQADEPSKKVVIKDLTVSSGKLRFSSTLMGGKAITIPLPKIQMEGIGEESGGVSIADAISLILGEILKSVGQAAAGSTDLAKAGLDKLGDGAGKAVGALGESASATLESLQDVPVGALADGAADAVGGLAGDASDAVGGALGAGTKSIGKGTKKIGESVGGLLKGSGSKKDQEENE
jgi:hypothetical protein